MSVSKPVSKVFVEECCREDSKGSGKTPFLKEEFRWNKVNLKTFPYPVSISDKIPSEHKACQRIMVEIT